MLKKRDKAQLFLKNHLELFQCPVCKSGFENIENYQLICEQKHQFDLNKKGTLHLMLKSVDSEYTRHMLLSRQRLAQSGFWQPLLDSIYTELQNNDGPVLDVGCGEGSHAAYLKDKGLTDPLIAFDISKEGINLAAATYPDPFFLVADLADSPFASGKYATLLNILSPSNYSEFKRLLKPDGQVIKVVPNPDYLKELRLLKESGEQSYSNEEVVTKFEEHFSSVHQKRVRYTYQLSEELRKDFINMTPLGWHLEKELNNITDELNEITIDLMLLVGSNA